MSDDFLAIDIAGIKELTAKFDKLPGEVQDTVSDDVYAYLLNVERSNPPYHYASRKSAYGQMFQSDKQRRWFFAALNEGRITPGKANRTQTFSRGWKIIGKGRSALLVNEVPYGVFLKDDQGQARQPALAGWQKLGHDISSRMNRIIEVAEGSAKKAIRKLGL